MTCLLPVYFLQVSESAVFSSSLPVSTHYFAALQSAMICQVVSEIHSFFSCGQVFLFLWQGASFAIYVFTKRVDVVCWCICQKMKLVLQFQCKLEFYCWTFSLLEASFIVSPSSFAIRTAKGGDLSLHLPLSVP